jgi:hypothetical protein
VQPRWCNRCYGSGYTRCKNCYQGLKECHTCGGCGKEQFIWRKDKICRTCGGLGRLDCNDCSKGKNQCNICFTNNKLLVLINKFKNELSGILEGLSIVKDSFFSIDNSDNGFFVEDTNKTDEKWSVFGYNKETSCPNCNSGVTGYEGSWLTPIICSRCGGSGRI